MAPKKKKQNEYSQEPEQGSSFENKEAENKERATQEDQKQEGFREKFKGILSQKEVKKQLAKASAGVVASYVGVKAFFDVPAYLEQRLGVRGSEILKKVSKGKKGRGLEGSVEDILSSAQQRKQKRESAPSEKKKEQQEGEQELIDEEVADARHKGEVSKKIDKLNKKLKKTKEGTQKHSEQRKMLAKLLWENRHQEKKNKEERREELKSILDDYTETKVSGMQAAKESLNTALTGMGAIGFRGGAYGLMSVAERYQKKSKEARREDRDLQAGKEVVTDGLREWYQNISLKGEKGKIKKGTDFAKAFGSLARFAGFGGEALSVSLDSSQATDQIGKMINALEDKQWGEAGQQFVGNIAERANLGPEKAAAAEREKPFFEDIKGIKESVKDNLNHLSQEQLEQLQGSWVVKERPQYLDKLFDKKGDLNEVKFDIATDQELNENFKINLLHVDDDQFANNATEILKGVEASNIDKEEAGRIVEAIYTHDLQGIKEEVGKVNSLTHEVEQGDNLTEISKELLNSKDTPEEVKDAFIDKYYPDHEEITDKNRGKVLEEAINKMSASNLKMDDGNDVQNLIYEGNEVHINSQTGEVYVEQGAADMEAQEVSEKKLRGNWADLMAKDMGLDPDKTEFAGDNTSEEVISTKVEAGDKKYEVKIDTDGKWTAEVDGKEIEREVPGKESDLGKHLSQEIEEARAPEEPPSEGEPVSGAEKQEPEGASKQESGFREQVKTLSQEKIRGGDEGVLVSLGIDPDTPLSSADKEKLKFIGEIGDEKGWLKQADVVFDLVDDMGVVDHQMEDYKEVKEFLGQVNFEDLHNQPEILERLAHLRFNSEEAQTKAFELFQRYGVDKYFDPDNVEIIRSTEGYSEIYLPEAEGGAWSSDWKITIDWENGKMSSNGPALWGKEGDISQKTLKNISSNIENYFSDDNVGSEMRAPGVEEQTVEKQPSEAQPQQEEPSSKKGSSKDAEKEIKEDDSDTEPTKTDKKTAKEQDADKDSQKESSTQEERPQDFKVEKSDIRVDNDAEKGETTVKSEFTFSGDVRDYLTEKGIKKSVLPNEGVGMKAEVREIAGYKQTLEKLREDDNIDSEKYKTVKEALQNRVSLFRETYGSGLLDESISEEAGEDR